MATDSRAMLRVRRQNHLLFVRDRPPPRFRRTWPRSPAIAHGEDAEETEGDQRDQIEEEGLLDLGSRVLEHDFVLAGIDDDPAEREISPVDPRILPVDRRGPTWIPDFAEDDHAASACIDPQPD